MSDTYTIEVTSATCNIKGPCPKDSAELHKLWELVLGLQKVARDRSVNFDVQVKLPNPVTPFVNVSFARNWGNIR